ncbi:MAG: methyltransferase domain-containing protein [Thaumarchaeota archaeon]|nr:methyltransferase domain-containing protein [Nitrososphaerota archaeon]
MDSPTRRTVKVIHDGDPWCWYSWGLEPVLQRLHEVYGDGIEISYRMGGVFESLDKWREKYGVGDDVALRQWIADSDRAMRNPFDLNYVVRSGMKNTWIGCAAVKAAGFQGEEAMMRFYRKLMEAIQVHSKDGSKDSVLKEVAEESGLNVERFLKDAHGESAFSAFRADRHGMAADKGNFFSLILVNVADNTRIQVQGYSSGPYEEAIDKISHGKLERSTPIDILEYCDKRRGFLITARELSEVFETSEEDVSRRMESLTKSGLFKQVNVHKVGQYWTIPNESKIAELTLKQVSLSHVTERAKVTEKVELEDVVKQAVKKLYTEVAQRPRGTFHFPVGRAGTDLAGYPEKEVEKIPRAAVESFAGVGYPHGTNSIREGDTVLDVGSGSGTDLFVASLRAGAKGKVLGLDMTEAMLEKAKGNVEKSGFKNIRLLKGDATKIPIEDSTVDVVTSNGVLNLVPDKEKAFQEIYRVLSKGGRFQLADIVTQQDVQAVCGIVPQLWADCIGGAAVEKDYLEMIRRAGFSEVRITSRLDYFSKSPESTRRLTKTFRAESVVISAKKP